MQDWTPDELKTRIEKGTGIFLKLWKPGCGACQLSKPAIERIEASDVYGLSFGQINTNDYPEMFEIADTDVLPVFFVFKDQKKQGKFIGFKGIQALTDFVSESLTKKINHEKTI
jgi:thioredoxin-like negative regulator of GroEL